MKTISATVLLTILGLSTSALAEEVKPAETQDYNPQDKYVGLLLGPAIVTSGGGGTHFTFGGHIGRELFNDGSAAPSSGLYVGRLSDSAKISGVSADAGITALLGEVLARKIYRTGLYLGFRTGASFTSVEFSNATTSISGSGIHFTLGPVVGYDFQLVEKLSLTADFSHLTLFDSEISFGSLGSYTYGASALLVQLGLTYQF